jgi:hypothetical protein
VLRQSDAGLVSAYDWRFDKKADKDTYATHASGRAIDFIVMSPGLAADCVDGSYFVLGTLHAASDWDFRKADEIPPPEGYASDHQPVAIDLRTKPDRKASEFKRPAAESGDSKRESTGKSDSAGADDGLRQGDVKSDARVPTIADLEKHAKPSGAPIDADTSLAKALQAAGWSYVLPYPKSKAAEWGKKGGNTTWWPGHWTRKGGATSATQPTQADGWKGDGKPRGDYTKTGAPAACTWVEWLSSAVGRAQK